WEVRLAARCLSTGKITVECFQWQDLCGCSPIRRQGRGPGADPWGVEWASCLLAPTGSRTCSVEEHHPRRGLRRLRPCLRRLPARHPRVPGIMGGTRGPGPVDRVVRGLARPGRTGRGCGASDRQALRPRLTPYAYTQTRSTSLAFSTNSAPVGQQSTKGRDTGAMASDETKESVQTMRAISQEDLGGPDVLREVDLPRPEPGPGEILIRVRAAGVNPTDWKHRRTGMFLGEPPFVLGWDVSGVVEHVGYGVTLFSPGDEVFGMVPYPFGVGTHA